ncbi:MAG: iron-containing alcohol dehydrogenase, partial [Alphaproteobacteria bacterium]
LDQKVERMAEVMQLEDHSIPAFIARIETMLDEIEIPRSLGEIGVPLDSAERLSHKALLDSAALTNPRPADAREIRTLIETAITGAR